MITCRNFSAVSHRAHQGSPRCFTCGDALERFQGTKKWCLLLSSFHRWGTAMRSRNLSGDHPIWKGQSWGRNAISLTGGYSPYENPTQAILAEYLYLDPVCCIRIELDPPVLRLMLKVLSNSVDQRKEGFSSRSEKCTEEQSSQANSSERNSPMKKVIDNLFPYPNWLHDQSKALLCRKQYLHFSE